MFVGKRLQPPTILFSEFRENIEKTMCEICSGIDLEPYDTFNKYLVLNSVVQNFYQSYLGTESYCDFLELTSDLQLLSCLAKDEGLKDSAKQLNMELQKDAGNLQSPENNNNVPKPAVALEEVQNSLVQVPPIDKDCKKCGHYSFDCLGEIIYPDNSRCPSFFLLEPESTCPHCAYFVFEDCPVKQCKGCEPTNNYKNYVFYKDFHLSVPGIKSCEKCFYFDNPKYCNSCDKFENFLYHKDYEKEDTQKVNKKVGERLTSPTGSSSLLNSSKKS